MADEVPSSAGSLEQAATTSTSSPACSAETKPKEKISMEVDYFNMGKKALKDSSNPTVFEKSGSDLLSAFRQNRRKHDLAQAQQAPPAIKKYVITPKIREVVDAAHRLSSDKVEKTRFRVYLYNTESRERIAAYSDPDPEWIPEDVLREAVDIAAVEDEDLDARDLIAHTTEIVPKVRPNPDKVELDKRLARLRYEFEQKEYDQLVADVAAREQAEKAREPFSGFMVQAGLGMDIHLMVAGGAMGGYFIGKIWGWPEDMRWIFAAVAAVIVLIVEGLLFVIKFSTVDSKSLQKAPAPKATVAKKNPKSRGKIAKVPLQVKEAKKDK